jgi:hypothetical protein
MAGKAARVSGRAQRDAAEIQRILAIRRGRFREATAVQEKPARYGDRKEKKSSTP